GRSRCPRTAAPRAPTRARRTRSRPRPAPVPRRRTGRGRAPRALPSPPARRGPRGWLSTSDAGRPRRRAPSPWVPGAARLSAGWTCSDLELRALDRHVEFPRIVAAALDRLLVEGVELGVGV